MIRNVTVARVTAENRCSARDPALVFSAVSVRGSRPADDECSTSCPEHCHRDAVEVCGTASHLSTLRFCTIRARCKQSDERRASQNGTVSNTENAGACEKIGEHGFVGLCGMGGRLLLIVAPKQPLPAFR
jgi:hypothetical protein